MMINVLLALAALAMLHGSSLWAIPFLALVAVIIVTSGEGPDLD